MLELKDFCFTIEKDGEPLNLVDRVSIRVPAGHFMAIVGPSGCGKTTLLNTIAGLNVMSEGSIFWNGRNLEEDGDFDPAELGYVPQFSIAYDELTVDESIEAVTKLRVKTRDLDDLDQRIDRVLEETGLAPIADRKVKVLSGGQKRRLGLAMELVTDPKLLLCDEVTSGLDPRSERDIVHRLHELSRRDGRIVISVTHSLAHIELYDSILVLHEGRVAYHGPPAGLTHYFSVDDSEEIYPRLAKQDSNKWRKSWLKHRDAYYEKMEKRRLRLIEEGELNVPASLVNISHHKDSATTPIEDQELEQDEAAEVAQLTKREAAREKRRLAKEKREEKRNAASEDNDDDIIVEEAEPVQTPGFISQYSTLLARRWKIFIRDRGQVTLQIAVMLLFPALVMLYADQGNAELQRFSDAGVSFTQESLKQIETISQNRAQLGSAISALILFQVVLLALMGANNAAREITSERKIMEKEKFGGVSPLAYLASKVTFLMGFILVQSLIMGIAVNQIWKFQGADSNSFLHHLTFLVLINAAMTFICLGISSLMKSSEKASLASIYLIGFQLLLSGAVLTPPAIIGTITRPFISLYWAWAGSINALDTGHSQAIKAITNTPIDLTTATSPYNMETMAMIILIGHVLVGIIATYIGIKRHQWEH